MKDLAVLVADKDMQTTLQALLVRSSALGIRPITFDIFIHPRRDPGCVNEAHLFLRPFVGDYAHALVIFDHEGCGRERTDPSELAAQITGQLANQGWSERARAVVIAPELEVWVWSRSPHVATCLRWGEREPDLRMWLEVKGYWPQGQPKPARPKEALEATLREIRRPRSSAIYGELAARVSLRGHQEPAFVALTSTLQGWFAAST